MSRVGRLADKQLARHPAHASLSIDAVLGPEGEVKLFKALSLMFGTTAAVYAFLRFSRALSSLAARMLDLLVIEFFDDFTQVEASRLAMSSQVSLEGLLDLLGWRVADIAEKRKPFAQEFVSLGVLVDFRSAAEGVIALRHKPGRVEIIKEQVQGFLGQDAKKMGFKDALSVRSRLGFAEGQTYGRLTAPVARMLSDWASIRCPRIASEELQLGLRFAIRHLETAGPRILGPRGTEKPILVFVDGACEAETSVGGVLLEEGRPALCFGAVVGTETSDSWKTRSTQTQVIGQAELFPLIVARLTWKERLANRRVIYFIDNESARIAMIRAYSPVLASLKLIMQCVCWDLDNSSTAWYARVPTACNPADGPSRMTMADLPAALNAVAVRPIFPEDAAHVRVLK